MTNINYEAEVKKVYPDAFEHTVTNGNTCILSAIKAEETSNVVAGVTWQSAYEKLKKQNKLCH
jgi:hypothetical protein